MKSSRLLANNNQNNNNNQGTNQVAVAKAMAHYANETVNKPSFVVALGDNFYTKGVSSTTDIIWTYLWTDIYLKYESLKELPWYAILGNHDYGYGATGVQAQVDKTFVENSKWNMPEKNYTKRFVKGDISVQIIFIDTTTLAPSENGCCNSKSGISSDMQAARIKDQLVRVATWLNDTLADPPNWLIVAGHYPVFSSGDHGDTDELLQYLLPLLQHYNVDVYLSGHDHISEHLKYENTSYYVVGAGCMTDQLKATSTAELLWYGIGYSAFAVMEATRGSLNMKFINTNNEVVYSSDHAKIVPTLPPKPIIITDDHQGIIPGNNSSISKNPVDTIHEGLLHKLTVIVTEHPTVSIGTSCALFAVLALLFSKMYYKLKMSKKSVVDGNSSSFHSSLAPPLLHIDIEKGTRSNGGDLMYSPDKNSLFYKKVDRSATPINNTMTTKQLNENDVLNSNSHGVVYNKLHSSSNSSTGIRSRRNTNTSVTNNSTNSLYAGGYSDKSMATTLNSLTMMTAASSTSPSITSVSPRNLTYTQPSTDDDMGREHYDHHHIRNALLLSGYIPVNSNNDGNVLYNTSHSHDRNGYCDEKEDGDDNDDDNNSDGDYSITMKNGSTADRSRSNSMKKTADCKSISSSSSRSGNTQTSISHGNKEPTTTSSRSRTSSGNHSILTSTTTTSTMLNENSIETTGAAICIHHSSSHESLTRGAEMLHDHNSMPMMTEFNENNNTVNGELIAFSSAAMAANYDQPPNTQSTSTTTTSTIVTGLERKRTTSRSDSNFMTLLENSHRSEESVTINTNNTNTTQSGIYDVTDNSNKHNKNNEKKKNKAKKEGDDTVSSSITQRNRSKSNVW